MSEEFDFLNMEPEDIVKIPLKVLSPTELRSLDYFLKSFYPEEPDILVEFRLTKVTPLVKALPNFLDEDDDLEQDELE